MKILVVGSGAREHALVWKLRQSNTSNQLFVTPGNPGAGELAERFDVPDSDIPGVVDLARAIEADLVVIGPEAPLAAGLADALEQAGISAFGPNAAAARIESSKDWAKGLMQRHGIPTARAESFSSQDKALKYVKSLTDGSFVVKADGLAAGKGVVVPETLEEARQAVIGFLGEHEPGVSGSTILIEERLFGTEVSVFAFIDGETVSAEIAACDYKRVGDGDSGPNTGGMGAYSPPEFWQPDLAARIRREILEPTARAMVAEGCPYRGVLYAGLMVTSEGPKVIEFNCRFGDPETQVILPRLTTDLATICRATADGRLADVQVTWGGPAHVCVVIASGGYPEHYETGFPISGIAQPASAGIVFHAGTGSGPSGDIVTAGGRVLSAVGSGATMSAARDQAYELASRISFEGARFRTDIAERAVVQSD